MKCKFTSREKNFIRMLKFSCDFTTNLYRIYLHFTLKKYAVRFEPLTFAAEQTRKPVCVGVDIPPKKSYSISTRK